MKWAIAALLLAVAVPVSGHELRPAYLEVCENGAGEFRVLWKTPMRGERRLALAPVFSGQTRMLTPVMTSHIDNAALQRWSFETAEPLRGQTVRIDGLEATMTDALVRIEFADGAVWTTRLTARQPAAVIPARQSVLGVAGAYVGLGVEHILLGIDHLLFVLALLLITRVGWKLLKTVTAFTVAHSITLGLATLGFVHVPPPPVEAAIALSIVFVAAEIIRTRRGQGGIAARAPWLVAAAFGLLHGFGFAGALSAVGLPSGHIPVALLFFNLGVEAGQLMFITAMLAVAGAVRVLRIPLPGWAELVPPYVIGSVAMFWVIQRIGAF